MRKENCTTSSKEKSEIIWEKQPWQCQGQWRRRGQRGSRCCSREAPAACGEDHGEKGCPCSPWRTRLEQICWQGLWLHRLVTPWWSTLFLKHSNPISVGWTPHWNGESVKRKELTTIPIPIPLCHTGRGKKKSEVKLGLDYLFMHYCNLDVKVLLSMLWVDSPINTKVFFLGNTGWGLVTWQQRVGMNSTIN